MTLAETACTLLVGPLVWSLSTLNPIYAGTANDAYAGPCLATANASQRMSVTLNDGNYVIGLASNRAVAKTAATETAMYRYASGNSKNAAYAVATDSWRSAAPLILRGGQRVLPIAGYSSRTHTPTAAKFRHMVADGSLPFIIWTGDGAQSGKATPHIDAVAHWVDQRCTLVPPSAYLPATRSGDFRDIAAATLYHCLPGTAGR